MPVFYYTAYQPGSKKKIVGKIEAEHVSEANRQLRSQNLVPVAIGEDAPKSRQAISFGHKVSLEDKIIFTRQLALMIKAGLPLINALEALAKQTNNKYFHSVITELITEVRGGKPLSAVLVKYPHVFAEVYVAVVRAGESTGQLSEVLFNLADQQEKQAEIISKVKGALMYPAVILVALLGVVFLIIFFVLPSLQSIFSDFGGTLPITTRILFAVSAFSRHYYWVVAIALVGSFYSIRFWFSRPSGRIVYDHIKIGMPIFGGLTKKVYMANFSRTMAMLVHASLPILQSIKIVQKTINNELYGRSFTRIATAVENGQALSKAITHEEIFPPMVSQLVALGEQSGDLESVLIEIARFYDTEVDNITKNMASLIEPIMLVIMGLGVGFIVASVLGPIYKLVNTIQ